MDVPELQERGDLTGIEWLWEAYLHLFSCRPASFGGPSRLPWTAAQEYARENEFNADETYMLHETTRHMDTIFLEYAEKKADKQMKVDKSKNRRSRRGSSR